MRVSELYWLELEMKPGWGPTFGGGGGGAVLPLTGAAAEAAGCVMIVAYGCMDVWMYGWLEDSKM